MVGIGIDEYLLVRPRSIVVNGVHMKNRNVAIIDKKNLLLDMWKQIEFEEKDRPDLVVDATGFKRSFLPKIKVDNLFETIQRTEKHEREECIFIYLTGFGYSWAFPLGNNTWHIGAGAKNREIAKWLIRNLRKCYGFDEIDSSCSCASKIRVLPPSKCRPFSISNVVGIGEAIGCVTWLGEGNVPSLISARVLWECIKYGNLDNFEDSILKELRWLEVGHRFVESVKLKNYTVSAITLPKVLAIESERIASPISIFLNLPRLFINTYITTFALKQKLNI